MRKVQAELSEHVGGNPSAAERVLIGRAARLTLQIAAFDAKPGALSEHDGRQYLAWTNTLTKLIRHLGLKGAAQRAPSLRDHIDARSTA